MDIGASRIGALAETVFVRFLGAGIDAQNFTDDIILDQTPPTLQAAQLLGATVVRSPSLSSASFLRTSTKLRRYRIKVKARDQIVGVCAVATSSRKSGGALVAVKNCHKKGTLRLAKTVTFKLGERPRYVRVRNSAGSWSRWLRLS